MNPLSSLRPSLRRLGLSLAAVAALAAQSAQAQLAETVGNLTQISPDGANAWKAQAQNAFVKIQFYSPTVAQVRYAHTDKWDDIPSVAVVAQPMPGLKVDMKDAADAVTFTTDSMQVVVTKQPLRIRMLTKKGIVVNEDEPAFGCAWVGEEVGVYKKLQNGERFIGLGEKTGNLDRKGEGFTNWNTDAFGYGAGQDPIYQSHPFYIGIHDGVVYGLFMDNTHKSHYNFGASNDRYAAFWAEAGEMNYFLIHNSNVAGIMQSYTWLTGHMPMPPLWGLGLQQCRYSYYPEARVRSIAQGYRDRQIPCDALVLDIHYMDKYKIFTWDNKRFPDPGKLTSDLKKMGFNTVTIHDPGIKVEKGYRGYDEGVAGNHFAKYPDGKLYTGQVWPGWCHFPQFGNKATRDWWRSSLKYSYTDLGVEGFWNDMNEPASWGQKMPSILEFEMEGKKVSHRRMHNIYGSLMSQASYEAGRALLNRRPFILTRAGYSGVHRYSAVWTGDNRSEDGHMIAGVRLMNSLGLAGVAYVGMDVGGFTGNPSGDLFARWVSIGAFSPFFRIHTAINTREADPWSFGEVVEAISSNYIKLRYRMLPYLYSSFYEASQSGMPINRTLAVQYSHDSKVYDGQYQNQFFFGPSVLVAPFESGPKMGKVYLPDEAGYYDLYNDKQYAGKQEIMVDCPVERLPVFVRGGSIIPMQSLVQTTQQQPTDTLQLHVYNGPKGMNYVYYEDDGASFDNEKGGFYKRIISLNAKGRSLSFSKPEGSYASKFKQVKVILHGFGKAKQGRDEKYVFIKALPHFDPQGTGANDPGCAVSTFVIGMPGDKVDVKF